MATKPTIDELLQLNPHIDPRQVERVRQLIQKQRAYRLGGVGRRRLASPLARRRAAIRQDTGSDSRTVRVGR